MKYSASRFKPFFCFLLAAAVLLASGDLLPARAAGLDGKPDSADKTLSPYFWVKSDDPATDRLPLKSTSAVVNISGVIADVVVTQVYKNEGKNALEAVYVFPASTRAAVYGMKMTIGERTITARIQKREDARRAYEKAKAEGRSASLLEQQRPNVFQMNVANILPGDEIRTELKYTELLAPTDGVYEFVYPAVVGPRYSNQAAATAPSSEKWSQNPYLHEGEAPPYDFNIKVNIAGGTPIREISCPSHRVNIRYSGKTNAAVELVPSEKQGGNRDFILRYRLTGDAVQSGMLLYKGEKENFFLLMMQPPRRISEKNTPAREYIFILDVSGSMHGFPLGISKKLIKNLAAGLRPSDLFNVLLFSGGSELFSERSVPATDANVRRAMQFIDRRSGSGGTELLPALKRALAVPRREGCSRTFVIATDGYVTVESRVFDLIRKNIGTANFFSFGIGTSVNRHLIEGMARAGAGEPFVITRPDEAPAVAEKFREYVQYPLLTGIKLDFGKFKAYDVEPPSVPDLFAERPVVVFGKWKGKPEGRIVLRGTGAAGEFQNRIDLSGISPDPGNSALRYLWARAKIAGLSDYNYLKPSDERIAQITDLGLSYNLLTAYTSFVAIDSEARRVGGQTTTVIQPLPLPQGVSDLAVGGRLSAKAMPAPYAEFSKSGTCYKVKTQARETGSSRPAPAKEPGTISIKIEKLTATGGVSKLDAEKIFNRHRGELQACLKGMEVPSPIKVTVKLTIGIDGKASRIELLWGPHPGSEIFSACLHKEMAAWRFPAPQSGPGALLTVVLLIDRQNTR